MSRLVDSVALFGTHASPTKLARLVGPYSRVVVWFDSDKFSTAVSLAETIKSLGKEARAIYSDLDPKYYDEQAIQEIFRRHSICSRR